MLQAFQNWLAAKWDWGWVPIIGGVKRGIEWGAKMWGWVAAATACIWSMWTYTSAAIDYGVSHLAAIVLPALGSVAGPVMAILNTANTVFPLSELFGMMKFYLQLLVALAVVKIGKKALGFLFGL